MARKHGGSGTERDANRLWDQYIERRMTQDQLNQIFSGPKNDAELQNKLKELVWGPSSRRPGKKPGPRGWNAAYSTLLDLVTDLAYKKTIYDSSAGKQVPLVKFQDTHAPERRFRIQDAEVRTRNYDELYKQLSRSSSKYMKRYLAPYLKQQKKRDAATATQRKKQSQALKTAAQQRSQLALRNQRAFAARQTEKRAKRRYTKQLDNTLPHERDAIRAQRGVERAQVTRDLRSTQPSPLTPKSQVSAQNYSSHLKQTQVTNSNKTAQLLRDLKSLEHKSKRKPLSQFKR
jgi:hypothetical protein